MKKILLLLLAVNLLAGLHAAKLEKVYYGDFGSINRVVVVTSSKPNYTLTQSTSQKKLIISLADCQLSPGFVKEGSFKTKVLSGVDATANGNNVEITLSTVVNPKYEQFGLASGSKYKLVFDLFNENPPQAYDEYLEHGNFYYKMSRYDQGNKIFADMARKFPTRTGYNFYWGKNLLAARQTRQAANKFALVSLGEREYPMAQAELRSMGVNTKVTEAKSTTPAKKEDPKQAEPVPEQAATEQPQQAPSQVDVWARYQKYFLDGSPDDQAFYAALVAQSAKDYDTAVLLFEKVESSSAHIPEVHKNLYHLYKMLGNELQAKQHAQYLTAEQLQEGNYSFYQLPLPLWLALIIAVIVALLVWAIGYMRRKRELALAQPEFTVQQEEDYQKRIDDAYQNADQAQEPERSADDLFTPPATEPEQQNQQAAQNPEESVQEFDLAPEPEQEPEQEMDFADPPLVTQELTPEEDDELFRQTSKIQPPAPEPEDGESLQFQDENYKRKLVLKMSKDGWDNKDIARELKMSQREVEFILKVMT